MYIYKIFLHYLFIYNIFIEILYQFSFLYFYVHTNYLFIYLQIIHLANFVYKIVLVTICIILKIEIDINFQSFYLYNKNYGKNISLMHICWRKSTFAVVENTLRSYKLEMQEKKI